MNTLSATNINSQISELRHLTLSIDKGITAEDSQQIIGITNELAKQWQNDKILLTFVKMLQALSSYAASKKGNIHADTSSLTHSILNQMEILSVSPGKDISTEKKQAVLSEEIAKYSRLKQQIKYAPQSDMDSNIIADLKSIILSLDWEITDEIIQRLDREVNKLQKHWQTSKIHLSFLQMFRSIGSYVLSKGSNTHPDSISLLHSLYKNFEHIVLNPSMTVATQKEILLKEMKKFNDLKQTISSAKISKVLKAEKERMTMSPMDDLIGTKVSNLSPVDDLIEEIHMLQDSGTKEHSPGVNATPHRSSQPAANPEIKEVIPNRLKKQPIPEIQKRLDAFFDEDESLEELSFADSGEEVVPYKGETTSSSIAGEQELNFNVDDESDDMEELIFEDDPDSDMDDQISIEYDSTPNDNEIVLQDDISDSKSDKSVNAIPSENYPTTKEEQIDQDGMVPYDFEDEFFDEEIGPAPSTDTQNKKADSVSDALEDDLETADIQIAAEDLDIAEEDANMEVEVQTIEDSEISEEIEILDKLKSTIAKCMFHGGTKDRETINEEITALENLWIEMPEKLLLLKMVKSLNGYLDLLLPVPEKETLELMLYIAESMDETQLEPSGIKNGKELQNNNLIGLFSRYIDFQSTIVQSQSSSHPLNQEDSAQSVGSMQKSQPEQNLYSSEKNFISDKEYSETENYFESSNTPETLADKEIFYEKSSEEDTTGFEQQLAERKGLWTRIKLFLGF